MRRSFIFTILVAALVLAATAFAGEVIDGVVATINRKPLLRSDWDEAVRFEAFMHQKRLADVSEAERVAALQRLIDRELLRAQMADAGTLLPKQDELRTDIAKLRAQFSATSDPAWNAMLSSYGLSESILAAHLNDEVQVMNFIDVQLRPNVRVQDSEVQTYYQTRFVPDLRQSGATVVPLKDVEPKIRELLVQQHMDEMLDSWLHNLRQQARVETMVPLPALNARLMRPSATGE
jgi:hypothetical protein